jgi:hypothetical protein
MSNYDVDVAPVRHRLALYHRDGSVCALTRRTQRLSKSYIGGLYNVGVVPRCRVLTAVWLSIHFNSEAERDARYGGRFRMATSLSQAAFEITWRDTPIPVSVFAFPPSTAGRC